MSPLSLGVLGSARVAAGASGVEYLYQHAYDAPNLLGTFSSVPLGAEAANRNIVIAAQSRGGGTFGAATIAGVAATKHSEGASSNIVYQVAIYSAVVPTGATGTITVAMTGNSDTMALGAWAVYGTLAHVGSVTRLGQPASITGSGLTIAAVAENYGGTTSALAGVTQDYGVIGWLQYFGGHTTATGSLTITAVGQIASNSALHVSDFTLT